MCGKALTRQSCKICESLRPFNISTIEALPARAVGVYGIWYKNQCCIYIGSAKNQSIKKRLLQHWAGSHNADLRDWLKAVSSDLNFTYIEIDQENIRQIESRLIRKLKPVTNIMA